MFLDVLFSQSDETLGYFKTPEWELSQMYVSTREHHYDNFHLLIIIIITISEF